MQITCKIAARLAQSVEHGTLMQHNTTVSHPRVVGSSPTLGELFCLSLLKLSADHRSNVVQLVQVCLE